MNKFWSPIHLSDVVGPLNSIGDDFTVDPRALLNPNRGPMLIDQFRFSGPSLVTAAGLAVIAVEIRFGSIPLMAKPITIGAFCPRFVGASGGIDNAIVPNTVPISDTVLVWHLAKPLYVPQNVQLTIRLVRQRLFTPGTQTEPVAAMGSIRVSVVGRSLAEDEPNPDYIAVPWVSEVKASEAGSNFVSSDADLINNHNVPLNVKAFGGVNYNTGSGIVANTPANLTAQMTGSNGTAIVRDPTPFWLLFPPDRGLLEVDAMLQPGEFFRTRLEVPSVPIGADPEDAEVAFTSIGMTGYRQVPCPKANVR